MKSVFYCLTKPAGQAANEIIDAISVSAVFDQPVAIAFLGEGVYQLLDETDENQGKNTTKLISALPTFDVEEFLVEQESLETQLGNFNRTDVEAKIKRALPQIKIRSRSEIQARMHEFDMVVTN